jgi:hypothetical protein
MDNAWGKIFGAGLLAVLLIVGFVFFVKRGDHLAPKGSVLKERTIALDDHNSLLLLDIRINNDSDVTMSVDKISMSVDLPGGTSSDGHVLGKSDLMAEFGFYPLLGEKFNPALAANDVIRPRAMADRMIAASFEIPVTQLDSRQKVTIQIKDASGAVAQFSGK